MAQPKTATEISEIPLFTNMKPEDECDEPTATL